MSEGTQNTKRYVSRLLTEMENERPETIYEGQQEDEYSLPPSNHDLPMNRLVLSILGITALSNSAYAIIAPFLPFEFQKKGVESSWLGYIFSIYSVAVVLCSPMVGKMISILGRRNLVQFGMLLMGSSFVIFGQLDKLESKEAFLTLALMNRFLQGFSSSLIQTTMYSISTNFFPDHKEAMVGYIEAATGIGLILGPLIGSSLYSIGGYHFIYNFFGSSFIVFSFFIKVIFDEDIDKLNAASISSNSIKLSDDFARVPTVVQDVELGENDDDDFKAEVEQIDETSQQDNQGGQTGEKALQIQISTFELLQYPKYLFACLSATLGYFLYGFMEPVLAVRAGEFGLSQAQIGIFFILMPIFYIPTSVYVQRVPNGIQKRTILIVSSFLSFFTNLFVGPSKIFAFPNSIWILGIGQCLRGIVDPFILVPTLPEMIETALEHYPPNCESQINDISSGLFNMFLGLGQIIGPIFGAIVTKDYGFQTTCDAVAIICLTHALLYYVVCDGHKAFKNSKWKTLAVDTDEGFNLIPMKSGIMSPCSNPISIKNFSYASSGRKIKVRRRKGLKEEDGDNLSIQYMSQHQVEKQMNLVDQVSVNSNAFQGKEINLDELKGELDQLNENQKSQK